METKQIIEISQEIKDLYAEGLRLSFVNVKSYDPCAALACFLKSGENGLADGFYCAGLLFERNLFKEFALKLAPLEEMKKITEQAALLGLDNADAQKMALDEAKRQAKRLYEQGLEAGSVKCAYGLGCIETDDRAKSTHFERAFDMLCGQSASGDVVSGYILAQYFKLGLGKCQKNDKKYFKHLFNAAEKGHTAAISELGYCYLYGNYTQKNSQLAYSSFQKAALAGEISGEVGRALCLLNGEGVAKDAGLAVELLQNLERLGAADGEALFALGNCYEIGAGALYKDISIATQYYKKAAEKGCGGAQLALARHINQNIKSAEEQERAFNLFISAAKSGNAEAKFNAGRCLLLGLGTQVNLHEAERYLLEAAQKNVAEAQFLLGELYKEADLPLRDYYKSYTFYALAESQGHESAAICAQMCRKIGQGTPLENKLTWEKVDPPEAGAVDEKTELCDRGYE